MIAPPNEVRKAPRFQYLYDWIEEPRFIRVLLFACYLIFGFGAWVALFEPPASILVALGHGYMMFLGGFLAFGSVVAAVGVLPGWYWLERTGTLSLAVGAAMYAVTVISLQVNDSSDLNRGLQLTFVLAATLALVIRLISIQGADLDPKR